MKLKYLAIIAIMLIATLLSTPALAQHFVVPEHYKAKVEFVVPEHDKTEVKKEDIKISYYIFMGGAYCPIDDPSKAPKGLSVFMVTRYLFDLNNNGTPDLVREETVQMGKEDVFVNVFISDSDNGYVSRVVADKKNDGTYDVEYKYGKAHSKTIQEIFLGF